MIKNLKNIELFIFDLDGTIYIGDREIDGSFLCVETLRQLGKKVCFFTNNSSRHHLDYVARLNKLGLSVDEDEIYTSGQATAEYLKENFNGKSVYLLGNQRLKREFEDYGIKVSDENPDVCVIGFDTSLTYDRLYTFCKYVKKGLPFIATHPDNFCPYEECDMPDVGAMLEMIRLTINKTPDVIIGKPFSTAGKRIEQKYGVSSDKIAMVGDRLYTDIAFGNNCKFTSILVLSGETDRDMLSKSQIKPEIVLDKVKDILALV